MADFDMAPFPDREGDMEATALDVCKSLDLARIQALSQQMIAKYARLGEPASALADEPQGGAVMSYPPPTFTRSDFPYLIAPSSSTAASASISEARAPPPARGLLTACVV